MKEPKRHPKLTKTTNHSARFRGGAKRRDRKPCFDLIPFEFLESVARVVLTSLYPCWTSQSRRDKVRARLQDFAFQPGTSMGWRVYQRAPNEIVMGLDESHLNFRVSVFLSEDSGAQWVTVSTIVHYNNWKGRAYFVPVRVGHQIIVPHAVRTAARKIRENSRVAPLERRANGLSTGNRSILGHLVL